MNFFNIKLNLKNNIILYFTIPIIIIWYLIFGLNLSYEPYIWDDLHFFREYSKKELKNIWFGNWDSDGIETLSYRPFAILYYHLLYLLFEENTFLLRSFVIFESLILILISNKLLDFLNFNKTAIFFFTLLIIFSKIFLTLISWFTISVLIFAYIISISSILLFLISIENKKISYYCLSIIFATIGILTREELYIMPAILFFIYFYKYEINIKNFILCTVKIFPFLFLIFAHMYLRKEFIPEADHLQIIGYSIKYGEDLLNFGGLIKAFKSSFLPMGYLSSQYSSLVQLIFSWVWISVISILIIILLKKNIFFKFKNILILILLVLICCLPHLTVARSFGIYFSSFFALALIAKLASSFFSLVKVQKNEKKYLSFFLLTLLLMSGTLGGIYRSAEHAKSMSQYSLTIIKLDAKFIYGYKNDNTRVSIPKKRYLKKERHLKDLNINDYNWGEDLNIKSKKLIKTTYEPLSF
tara:strand:+ start:6620 stop:8029 length:1410 start_codon:yes stop_codon:yes gene_type:complete